MSATRGAVLVAATVTMGLAAGLFATFGYAVMTGLARTDDRTFVAAMRAMNVAILNPAFAVCFLGGPALTALALVLSLRAGGGRAVPFLVAGLALYLLVLVVTFAVSVPLNDALEAAGGDAGTARLAFEAPWVRWNVVRSLLSAGAFTSVALALLRSAA
jgi:uncharacterized membrane protein